MGDIGPFEARGGEATGAKEEKEEAGEKEPEKEKEEGGPDVEEPEEEKAEGGCGAGLKPLKAIPRLRLTDILLYLVLILCWCFGVQLLLLLLCLLPSLGFKNRD